MNADLTEALYRVGEKRLSGLRSTKKYRASMSIAAGGLGGKPKTEDSHVDPTKRYSAAVDLSVFRTGVRAR